jgi:hypothetical protein
MPNLAEARVSVALSATKFIVSGFFQRPLFLCRFLIEFEIFEDI